jgi:hypothetical protein
MMNQGLPCVLYISNQPHLTSVDYPFPTTECGIKKRERSFGPLPFIKRLGVLVRTGSDVSLQNLHHQCVELAVWLR